MASEVNCPHDGTLIEVATPTGNVRAVTADYNDGPRKYRRRNQYLEVGCDCGESFWVFYS
jgi:hypothetical protein